MEIGILNESCWQNTDTDTQAETDLMNLVDSCMNWTCNGCTRVTNGVLGSFFRSFATICVSIQIEHRKYCAKYPSGPKTRPNVWKCKFVFQSLFRIENVCDLCGMLNVLMHFVCASPRNESVSKREMANWKINWFSHFNLFDRLTSPLPPQSRKHIIIDFVCKFWVVNVDAINVFMVCTRTCTVIRLLSQFNGTVHMIFYRIDVFPLKILINWVVKLVLIVNFAFKSKWKSVNRVFDGLN